MRWLLLWLTSLSMLQAYEFQLIPKQVSPGVTCFFGEPEIMNKSNNGNMVNTCYIDTQKSYVVIDSGSSYAYAESVYNAMQKIKTLPVELVINTHIHDDHWLGNGFYIHKGAMVLGSDDFVKNAVINSPSRIQTHISPEAYVGTIPTLPNQLINSNQTLKVGDQQIELHIMKQKAHSDKDVVIYLPKSKTLFAGDLIFNDRIPSVTGGDINGWISALEEIKHFDAVTIIGGHGYKTDKNAADMTRNYLLRMRDQIRAAINSGIGIDDAVKKIDMPEYKSLRMYDTLHRSNVEASYRVLEWEQ